jgi:hypothetical protein
MAMETDQTCTVSLAKGPIASKSALQAAGFEGNFMARGRAGSQNTQQNTHMR